jgi:proteic killer suppression protein
MAIKAYKDKRTRQFAEGVAIRQFSPFRRQAERRLEVLDAAQDLQALRALRSNRFEALKGDRKGQYSLRINNQWRICFTWPKGQDGPDDVEIIDYHWWKREIMARTPIHPGEILAEELEERTLVASTVAKDIGVPPNRLLQIAQSKRNITADTALRLGRYFGTGAQFWMNLQVSYELRLAEKTMGKVLEKIPVHS